ncbi:hypothetical protein [Stieleria varia]|uniref:Tetratricopeptide repeat protein n=1 Tax=Stieleria varia TaxID=2528005 RepID=A0A5C6AUV0_9BACT|nr:hypothetical protein [Stieleria varia]TWU02979.1 hypothetical protein Pla52n_40680 [Stieleria varia]
MANRLTARVTRLPALSIWPLILITSIGVMTLSLQVASATADDESLENQASWHARDAESMSGLLRQSLDQLGAAPVAMDETSQRFLSAIEQQDADPLDAFVSVIQPLVPSVRDLIQSATDDPIAAAKSMDPSQSVYAEIESLPKQMRMSVRTWLGRLLVRQRLFDEALPVIAEVDVVESLDPASALFYRGACYHALLMKKDALTDLRRLLENEADSPVRFTRTAKLMIADIKPLKEDSLDEISRLMSDVTRRLDLGRSNEQVEDQEQKIIDKLTKLIEKLEEQQQQQQQQQQSQSGQGSGKQEPGQAQPMQDSQIAGGSGNGNVDKKKFDEEAWGNLPPAERKEALQQISRDLPTHYRDAIEAYFRKLATDK